MEKEKLDIQKVKVNPSSYFSNPEDIKNHPGLSAKEKIELLKQWQYDANELLVAEEEGMLGGDNSMLPRIEKILSELLVVKEGASSPIKQGGKN